MIGLSATNMIHPGAASIDDCWNRIGVRGDQSCERLHVHVHCRNCEVHAAAATSLLDRYALLRGGDLLSGGDERVDTHGRGVLVMRLGEEWLALPSSHLVEVAPHQTIHSLPHQRSRALRGVANVRGALVPVLDLGQLIGLPATGAGGSERAMPRLLILDAPGGPVVLPVDEVDGIHRFDPALLERAGTASRDETARLTLKLLQWQGRSLRLLDPAQLLASVARSLT